MREKIKYLLKRLLYKYRFTITNEDSLEDRLSIRLSRLNVFLIIGVTSVLLISTTILLVSHTPLKEYVIEGESLVQKERNIKIALKIDSLERELSMNNKYIDVVQKVLTGKISFEEFDNASLKEDKLQAKSNNLKLIKSNKQDSILRETVALEDRYNTLDASGKGFVFRPPLKGKISSEYNPEEKHFGIDLIGTRDDPIEAIAAGVVIFQEWTLQTGYVVIISHSNNIISIYKHNDLVFKKEGEFVKSGEIIATVGNTGEYSNGYHLHFEIWIDGYSVNPKDIVNFD